MIIKIVKTLKSENGKTKQEKQNGNIINKKHWLKLVL